MTVTGPHPAGELGVVLPHEHVLVDFGGADVASPARYVRAEVHGVVRPHLEALVSLGVGTLFECTPAFLGRDPLLLRELSRATGLRIVTNTGYYAARGGRHLPPHAFSATADELAARWTAEWEHGIDGTGIRPGFLKIGVDPGSLNDVEEKLVRAAARTHRRTGLTIAVHTGPAEAAFRQLEILGEEGVDPAAWIWVHAQGEDDAERHLAAARRGGWVAFDGVSPERLAADVARVVRMREAGLLGRTLVSQDAGWYHVGEPGGGAFRGFGTLSTAFLPALREAGLTEAEIHRLVVLNPAEAFAIRTRTR